MSKPPLMAAAAAICAAPAMAGMHQICYEGPPDNGRPTVVVGCQHDSGSCEVSSITNAGSLNPGPGYLWPAMPVHHFRFFKPGPGSRQIQATIVFRDAQANPVATRTCTVERSSHITDGGPAAPAGAYLVGFSTDVSGLVMTAVWRAEYTESGVAIKVPGDFVAVGGGIATSDGAFVQRSLHDWRSTWQSSSFTDAGGPPASTVTYAIGMKIEGLIPYDEMDALNPTLVVRQGLGSMIQKTAAVSASNQAVPDASVMAPAGRVVIGGQFRAAADASNSALLRGQYATVSAPVYLASILRCTLAATWCAGMPAQGWRAESKDDLGGHPGSIHVEVLHLPAVLTIGRNRYEVRSAVVRGASAAGTEPRAGAEGLLGKYAVTATGGEVQWRAFNPVPQHASLRLTSIEPRADRGGAEATARHGSVVTAGTVAAHAVGVQLVPAGTPADRWMPPLKLSDSVWVASLCKKFALDPELSMCRVQKAMKLGELCGVFATDLKPWCRP